MDAWRGLVRTQLSRRPNPRATRSGGLPVSRCPAEGGLAWLRPNWPERRPADDLYEGTAGVLVGLAEARLTGITEFDDVAQAA